MVKQEIIQQLINAYSDAYQNLGYSSLMGKIVALMLTTPEPLSLDEISESLQMSKGPISQISRKLKDHHLIEKVWVPGERKDFYKASDDIFGQAFANYARSMKRNKLIADEFIDMLEGMEMHDEDTRHLTARMQEMSIFYEAMDDHNSEFLKKWKNQIRPAANFEKNEAVSGG